MLDPDKTYRVKGYSGVAFYLMSQPSEGHVIVRMVGDDRDFEELVEDLTPLDDEEYCGICGQIGCGHG